MDQCIIRFCQEFDFPKEALAALLAAAHTIKTHPEAGTMLLQHTSLFWSDLLEDDDDLALLDQISDLTGIHRYTVYLLFYITCAETLKEHYIEKGISLSVYRDTLLDLRWKMNETYRVYGIWGVFCGDWFPLHFHMRLFDLGRLEFEISKSEFFYENKGYTLHPKDPLLMVHIPESGSLQYEKALDSYRKAEQFFSAMFGGNRIAFACESWMLDPTMQTLYPEGNLKIFAKDFHILHSEVHEEEDDRWRIFHMPNDTDIKDYPEDTTLQKNVKQWLLLGNRMKIGTGVFFFSDGRVVPHRDKA